MGIIQSIFLTLGVYVGPLKVNIKPLEVDFWPLKGKFLSVSQNLRLLAVNIEVSNIFGRDLKYFCRNLENVGQNSKVSIKMSNTSIFSR